MIARPTLASLLSLILVVIAGRFLPHSPGGVQGALAGTRGSPSSAQFTPRITEETPWPAGQDPELARRRTGNDSQRASVVTATSASTVRPAMTPALQGETLRTLALRVYGDPGAAVQLLRVNRDLVASADEPLPTRSLVRTPDLGPSP